MKKKIVDEDELYKEVRKLINYFRDTGFTKGEICVICRELIFTLESEVMFGVIKKWKKPNKP